MNDDKIAVTLCPDCGINFIPEINFKQGKLCSSCTHRKIWATKKGDVYVKFKDLPETSKSEYLRNKNLKNTTKNLNSVGYVNTKKKINKWGICRLNVEQKNYLHNEASIHITVRELHNQLINKFPELQTLVDTIGLQKYMHRAKLPFRKLTREEKNRLLTESRLNRLNPKELDNSNTDNSNTDNLNTDIKENSVDDDNLEIINNENVNNSNIDNENIDNENIKPEISLIENIEDRFKPIEEEVNTVLQNKFKELNCELGYNFTVQDYITALTIMRYLISNYKIIETKRHDQWDIANSYQTDIVHEMENEISAPGDTYFQDKCHTLRNIRRNFELDSKAIDILKPFLISLKTKTNEITNLIDRLKNLNEIKEDSKYLPSVDYTLSEKYNWAQKINPSKKIMAKPILITNSKINKENGVPVFKASCYLSGNGYGIFKYWSKEYSYHTIEEADKIAKSELEDIKKRNGGLLISNYRISKISR